MLDTVFRILKITVIIAISAVFMVAITALINLVNTLVFGNVIGEVFALISVYMPFNAGAVFSSMMTVCVAILSFMIAKKIFDLTSWGVNSI